MDRSRFRASIAAACLCAATLAAPAVPAGAADRIPVSKLSDLPTHTYAIPRKPSEMIIDQAAMLDLARAMRANLRADLEKYDIRDVAAVRRIKNVLTSIAFLEGDDATARALILEVRAAEEKPSPKLTSGVVGETLLDVKATAPADFDKALQDAISKKLSAMPYAVIQDYLKAAKGSFEVMSQSLMTGSIATSIDPAAAGGKLDEELAETLVGVTFTLRHVLPHKAALIAAYTAVLDANRSERKADIWQARDVTLDASRKLSPVVVGIWDSGTDVKLFSNQLWVNAKEVPGNGKDDDGNGFVDDVHGIGWTLHADPTPEQLFPIATATPEPDRFKTHLKGFMDLQANVDSPEATALKKKIAGMAQGEVKPFIEGMRAYSMYVHGTHVSGIAVQGNPAARLMPCRITFDHRPVPEKPSIEQAKKDAESAVRSIAYFKQHGARVVNMSWGGDLRSIETALEQNNAGGTADERRALARKIYDINYDGLLNAMKQAPEILFVCAAGNSNNDVKFDEVIPSSFKLPNMMVAGAVDQAGEETSFTSFGNCDVYSDGFEVDSYIPGGEKMELSGTSMASPNVTNLAAKLWALDPKLTVAQVKSAIVAAAEDRKSGDKTIKLINPKATVAIVQGAP